MDAAKLLRRCTLALSAGLLPQAALAALEAEGVLRRALEAMGGDVKSVRYTAEGTGHTFGQAYKPGMAWPKIQVHNQTRTINYDTGSMREEFTLERAEPRGGGGYPLTGQQRNDQFVSGDHAWNQAAAGPLAGARWVAERQHQMWITPHGIVKAALKNKATLEWDDRNGKSTAVVSFTEPGRYAAKVHIGESYLVERVDSRYPDAVLGETAATTRYSDYRDFGGMKFPGRIEQSVGGHPVLDVKVSAAQRNAPADIAVPEAVRNASDRVTTDKVADGVWFVAGGSHNSVAIEMKDHFVVVEAPLLDSRAAAVFDAVKKLAPGKPIRYVVNSHSHFDHSGGLRAAVAEGATIVTHALNKPYFEKAFATRGKIAPDLLTKSGRKATVLAVKDKHRLSDGSRTIELHGIRDSIHTDTFLMAYLPKERLLIEADAYTPLPPNAPRPAQPNANHVNLIDNIERLKLTVDRILPLHGRVVPLSELYATAGRTRQ